MSANSLQTLTAEQQTAFQLLLAGKNVFLTGGGGVGKSYLLSMLYTHFPGMKRALTKEMKIPRVQLCALTGCAALLLGHKAKTIHSWAGIGLGKGTINELYIKIKRNSRSLRNWHGTDLLIIDEISMMTAELVDKLDGLGKKIRGNSKPFGGIQVLFVGDFFQLPPVVKGDEIRSFAFEAEAWRQGITHSLELTVIKRQKDIEFQTILKEARTGTLSRESCAVLEGCKGKNWRDNKIRPTLLFPRRAEVEMINDSNLKALQGTRHMYKARLVYDGKIPAGFTEKDERFATVLTAYDSNAPYLVDLELVINTQVMLIANVDPDSGLVNGSRGVIVGFCPATDLPIVEFLNGIKKPVGTHSWPIEEFEFVSRTQVPLRLAYASTIHRSQGSSLDAALVDIGSGNFEYGQAYVALSRVRSLDALYVHDFDPVAFKAHPRVKQFYKEMQSSTVDSPAEQIDLVQLYESILTAIPDKPILSTASVPVRGITVNKLAFAVDTVAAEEKEKEKEKEIEYAKETDDIKDPGTPFNWLEGLLPNEWRNRMSLTCRIKLVELSTLLDNKEFLPKREEIFISLIPLKKIRVVILGQDPYPTPGNAHGLAFSVLPTMDTIPASLRNIYKELSTDIGFIAPTHGNLQQWVDQGVMLLNTVLTVEAGKPQSHANIGWEEITDTILHSIAAEKRGVIFVLWGKSAQTKKKIIGQYIDSNKHSIIEATHPSPLSAYRGFFGSKPFSAINRILEEKGESEINWTLT
jgi:ATP-dependent DNA helicase PIF1